MKNFRVTVNGNTYDVSVEELGEQATAATVPSQNIAEPPKPATVQPQAKPQAQAPEKAQKITSPMPGTILDIKVKEGDLISKNQLVIVLEAMKMENEIVSPYSGKIASINTSKGAVVNSGDLLLSIIEQ